MSVTFASVVRGRLAGLKSLSYELPMFRILTLIALLFGAPSLAATSSTVQANTVTARLVTVEDGVGPGSETISAGLQLVLEDGWKTYWRSPGEVGLPPDLSWDGSGNVASVDLAYPAPSRFEAFGIQNFGYAKEVVYPLTVRLIEPGEPARLVLTVNILVCAEICVPETLNLTLDIPAGGGIDAEAAALLSDWIARVPGTGDEAGMRLETVHMDDTTLTVLARSEQPFLSPDIFPERGDYAAFDRPEIVLADGGRTLFATLPVLNPGEGTLDLTLVDGRRAATMAATLSPVAPAPPAVGSAIWGVLLIALLGGLILNIMPCVLPVLSLKLASALQARDKSVGRVRGGFLASAAGVLVFFLGLAGVVIALRAAGVTVGWGMQFQNPTFLALMIALVVLFAANMLGLFAVNIGQGAMTGMAKIGGSGGWGGDFTTGMFAAVMATPCSAPFIGTAITYALTNGPTEIVAVFAAMGVGLSLPYLAVAVRPTLIQRLPRPGRWMRSVQMVLGGLLLLTAIWLITVLAASAGARTAVIVGVLVLLMLGALALRRQAVVVGGAGVFAVLATVLLLPSVTPAEASVDAGWEPFSEARIAQEVAAGNTVFVDVTADWCLTCKANKRLVLDRDPVSSALADIVALQADWTRPSDTIAAFLQANDRFGIPFNAVYGPGAPNGIVLPELLTDAVVLDAISAAAAN
tara:strand:+ start:1264 stop:3342 length:2079 start_codon:yes stop_codon:yes gene_type:complete